MAVSKSREFTARIAVNIRMPVDVHEGLTAHAQREERSLNQQIVYALRAWLAAQPKPPRKTLPKALQSAASFQP